MSEYKAILICQSHEPKVVALLNELNEGFNYIIVDELFAELGSEWRYLGETAGLTIEVESAIEGHWCYSVLEDETVQTVITELAITKRLKL